MFNSRKKAIQKLKNNFGKPKTEYFNFGMISLFYDKCDSPSLQKLSDKTCNDLDFDELFMFLDRTHSKIGQQYFYNKLRTLPLHSDQLQVHEEIIDVLSANETLRLDTQHILSQSKKEDAFYIASLFQEKYAAPPKWFFVIPLMSISTLITLVLLFFYPKLIALFTILFIANLIIHYWNKKNLFQYLGAISQLITLNKIAKSLFKNNAFTKLNNELQKSISIIESQKIKMSFFQLETSIQGDFQIIFWGLFEILKSVFLLEPILLFSVLKQLNKKRDAIQNVFNFVGEIDSLISIASIRKGADSWCIPQINETNSTYNTVSVYHPLIENCVPNSINVDRNSILLTGSNMSGKTSFIRTIGINLITGLTLNTCFAKSCTIPRIKLFSAIRISDDLMNQKSYYFEEVLTIKEMIEESNSDQTSLFLLDEIFKGTNTVERISAGKAVLSYLAKGENIVFVSTHDIELADLLHKNYSLYHFSEVVENKSIDFDYKLKTGKLQNRNAIRILEINDYPQTIIDEAYAISENLDMNAVTE